MTLMSKAQQLQNQPTKVTAVFSTPVTVWNFCRNVKVGHSSKQVNKITIEGADWQYHTYGDGIISYSAEWFDKSVRPLIKHEICFYTTECSMLKMEFEHD